MPHYRSVSDLVRIHVQGELSLGCPKTSQPGDDSNIQYGISELCEWLWNNKGTTCLLLLTLPGGDMDAAHALMMAMRRHAECHTYGIGHVGSAGVDILHTGKSRGLHPDTTLMTHRGTKIHNSKARNMCEARDRKIYADQPNILEHWHKIFPARDRYWTAEEAVKQGFAQYVSDEPYPGWLT